MTGRTRSPQQHRRRDARVVQLAQVGSLWHEIAVHKNALALEPGREKEVCGCRGLLNRGRCRVKLGGGLFVLSEHDVDLLRVGGNGDDYAAVGIEAHDLGVARMPTFSASRSRNISSSEKAALVLFPATSASTEPIPDAARTRKFLPAFFPRRSP